MVLHPLCKLGLLWPRDMNTHCTELGRKVVTRVLTLPVAQGFTPPECQWREREFNGRLLTDKFKLLLGKMLHLHGDNVSALIAGMKAALPLPLCVNVGQQVVRVRPFLKGQFPPFQEEKPFLFQTCRHFLSCRAFIFSPPATIDQPVRARFRRGATFAAQAPVMPLRVWVNLVKAADRPQIFVQPGEREALVPFAQQDVCCRSLLRNDGCKQVQEFSGGGVRVGHRGKLP